MEGRERYDLRALYETSQLLSGSLDVDFVLDNLLRTAMSKLLVTRGVVLLYDPLQQGHVVASAKGLSALRKGTLLAIDNSPEPAYLIADEVPEPLQTHRIALVLPISAGHRHLGLVGLGAKATRQSFSMPELEFVQSLVHMSSAAVQNALMVNELRTANRDLDNKVQKLNTLFDLATGFGAAQDRDRVLKLLSLTLMGHMLLRKFVLLLQSPDGYRVAFQRGLGDFQVPDALRKSTIPSLVMIADEQAPEWQSCRAHGLVLGIPLHQHQETRGILCLGEKADGQPYNQTDVEFLAALGYLTVTSLENVDLVRMQIEKELLEEEMRLARSIQQRLLPQSLPHLSGLSMATWSEPTRQVGGDFFDVRLLDEHRLLLAIADVTGKGMPAALLMSNFQACLRYLLLTDGLEHLAKSTTKINTVVTSNTDADKFITFFWGVLDLKNKVLTYVNAGHDAPLLVHAGGEVRTLEAGGLLLGVLPQATYEHGRVHLEPGDRLLLFTDGITEAMNTQRQEWGLSRLLEVLRATPHADAEATIRAIRTQIGHWVGAAPQSDDITLIALTAADPKTD